LLNRAFLAKVEAANVILLFNSDPPNFNLRLSHNQRENWILVFNIFSAIIYLIRSVGPKQGYADEFNLLFFVQDLTVSLLYKLNFNKKIL
jgi:hypothetical protein